MSKIVSEAGCLPALRLDTFQLQEAAAASARGSMPVYAPDGSMQFRDPSVMLRSALAERTTKIGTQEVVCLADDLLLVRTNFHAIPAEQRRRWELDFQGWLYLHFRLDGASEEETPDGLRSTHDGECFLLSASHRRPCARRLHGSMWRTIGILCRPSFAINDLQMPEDQLPQMLQRVHGGDPDADFWYAGELTNDMRAAVVALLQPQVHSFARPVYLRAKVVELVCLAIEHLSRAIPSPEQPIKLTDRDVRCLLEARRILTNRTLAPSLEELAKQVGINRSKLALGFKQVFAVTVGQYHRERRLELARDTLEKSAVTIGQVATEAGYADAGSFSKAFRARYGHLPSDVRTRNDFQIGPRKK